MTVSFLGVSGLRLCWPAFFDDYTKRVDWGTLVESLGVVIDLDPPGAEGQFVQLDHTEARVQELDALIESSLDKVSMSLKDAERLRGKLQWFESFAYGRIAHQALRTLSGIASSGREKGNLTNLELQALTFLRHRVLQAPPTKVLKSSLKTWILFSDGACEGNGDKQGTIGAVLVSFQRRSLKIGWATFPKALIIPSSNGKRFQYGRPYIRGNHLSRTVIVCSTSPTRLLVVLW